MKKIMLFVLLTLFSASYASGSDINYADITTSDDLKSFTKEAGYAISIPSMTSSSALGLMLGVDIGIEASSCNLDKTSALFDEDRLDMMRLHVQKGLPFCIDVGAEYSKANNSNLQSLGAEARWGVLEDGAIIPAVNLRGMYSALFGVDNVELVTYGGGIQASKEILFVTPYVGWNYLISKGSVDGSGLDSEKEINSGAYIGVNVSFLLDITAQADFNENPMYSLKLGVSF